MLIVTLLLLTIAYEFIYMTFILFICVCLRVIGESVYPAGVGMFPINTHVFLVNLISPVGSMCLYDEEPY